MTPAPDDAASVRRGKADVVDAAMAVLDEHGIAGLSMRRIADALDLQVSALYWHFPNKQALLAAVSARIVGADTDGAETPQDLAVIAAALRERLLAHRDGAEVVSSSLALGLLDLPARAALVQAALAAGLDATAAEVASDTLVHYVIGYTFHEQQRMHASVVGAADASVDLAPARIDDRGDTFDAGLAMVVAGVRSASALR